MIKPYVDKNPCIDEYADAFTISIRGWSLIGIEASDGHIGFVLLNQAAGTWNDTKPEDGSYFGSVPFGALLRYVAKLATVGYAVLKFWQLLGG